MKKEELIEIAKKAPHWYSEAQIEELSECDVFEDEIDQKLTFAMEGVTSLEELYDRMAENLLVQEILYDEFERRCKSGFLSEEDL